MTNIKQCQFNPFNPGTTHTGNGRTSILHDRHPIELTAKRLANESRLPITWEEQRKNLAIRRPGIDITTQLPPHVRFAERQALPSQLRARQVENILHHEICRTTKSGVRAFGDISHPFAASGPSRLAPTVLIETLTYGNTVGI